MPCDRCPHCQKSVESGLTKLLKSVSVATETAYSAQIIAEVARRFTLAPEDLVSRSKSLSRSRPRMMACYLVREMTMLSWHEIGRCFRRDHTTIIHAHKWTIAQMAQRPMMKQEIERLMAQLREHRSINMSPLVEPVSVDRFSKRNYGQLRVRAC